MSSKSARAKSVKRPVTRQRKQSRREKTGNLGRASQRAVRDLSLIKFADQHWWKRQPWQEQFWNETKTSIDQQKTAVIYEAMRRNQEVRNAWLRYEDALGANGWQPFVGLVVQNLPKAWVDLNEQSQSMLKAELFSKYFIPPEGYSIFPHKASSLECEKASFEILPCHLGQDATRCGPKIQRLVDAGFVIVAIDNKTNQSGRYAINGLSKALKAMPRSNIAADLQNEYVSQPASPADGWVTIGRSTVANKRMRKGKAVEANIFNPKSALAELCALDLKNASRSAFVDGLRLK